jgi:hypothetical protein
MMDARLGEHTFAPDSYMVSLAPSLAILSSHGVREVGCPKTPRSPCPMSTSSRKKDLSAMMEATHAVAEPQLSKGARTIAKQDHNIRLRPAEVLRRGWRLRRRGILPQVLQLSPEPSVLRPEGRQLVCWQGMRCKHPADHRREHGAPSRVPACTAGGCCHSRLCRRWDTFSLSAQQTITLPSSRHRQDYHSL